MPPMRLEADRDGQWRGRTDRRRGSELRMFEVRTIMLFAGTGEHFQAVLLFGTFHQKSVQTLDLLGMIDSFSGL